MTADEQLADKIADSFAAHGGPGEWVDDQAGEVILDGRWSAAELVAIAREIVAIADAPKPEEKLCPTR